MTRSGLRQRFAAILGLLPPPRSTREVARVMRGGPTWHLAALAAILGLLPLPRTIGELQLKDGILTLPCAADVPAGWTMTVAFPAVSHIVVDPAERVLHPTVVQIVRGENGWELQVMSPAETRWSGLSTWPSWAKWCVANRSKAAARQRRGRSGRA